MQRETGHVCNSRLVSFRADSGSGGIWRRPENDRLCVSFQVCLKIIKRPI